ncbi:MAG: hypothetical protein HY360_23530 [Verrucomicrobia bacterium]|nr:hypothetical protein [Verrucomicrobiota bacterium]
MRFLPEPYAIIHFHERGKILASRFLFACFDDFGLQMAGWKIRWSWFGEMLTVQIAVMGQLGYRTQGHCSARSRLGGTAIIQMLVFGIRGRAMNVPSHSKMEIKTTKNGVHFSWDFSHKRLTILFSCPTPIPCSWPRRSASASRQEN